MVRVYFHLFLRIANGRSARISADGMVTLFYATPEHSKGDLLKLLQDI